MGEFSALSGREIEQIWVWKSFIRLVFELGTAGAPGVHIDLTDCRLHDAAGGTQDIRVEDDPLTAGPVLGLLNHRVTAARVRDWELVLGFDTGASIVCPPQGPYEAWTACLHDNLWICPPGGPESGWPHP
ncbi:hypothetical protein IU448_18905 [Nocardia flavorosea]|uniref:DUF6188 family protein n=1 Tax=Nocardia flavorosea TaxID=53429 RepID=UPI001892FFD3|nr:DUF6188 family protein [Nocardia flavorosea]MBF6351069.1 hypothetical protein [Nocardia flavorosea]